MKLLILTCPECDGEGEELEEIIEGWSRYEYCGWCDGEGKMTIARRWEWQWFYKIRPAIANSLKGVVPKKIQAAYDKKMRARMEKAWQDEMRCMKNE